MPKRLPEDLDARIEAEIARHKEGIGIVDLSKALAKVVSRRTLQRRLNSLIKQLHVLAKGEGRARVYLALGSVDIHSLIETNRPEVARLCQRFNVRRLELFGSAASGDFDPQSSDVDFLVEFQELPPVAYADAYFGLLEALSDLLQRPVDLVTLPSVKNPYFLRGIEQSRTMLYAA